MSGKVSLLRLLIVNGVNLLDKCFIEFWSQHSEYSSVMFDVFADDLEARGFFCHNDILSILLKSSKELRRMDARDCFNLRPVFDYIFKTPSLRQRVIELRPYTEIYAQLQIEFSGI